MLKMNDLKPAERSKRKAKRIGRGAGSGWGCTAGRGNNGARARSGATTKLYFEGGQTPLTRRLPKRGFNHNTFKIRYQLVNIGDIQKAGSDVKVIDALWLFQKGLVHSKDKPIKILGNGEFDRGLEIKAEAFSQTAREKIEKAKGKAEVIRCA